MTKYCIVLVDDDCLSLCSDPTRKMFAPLTLLSGAPLAVGLNVTPFGVLMTVGTFLLWKSFFSLTYLCTAQTPFSLSSGSREDDNCCHLLQFVPKKNLSKSSNNLINSRAEGSMYGLACRLFGLLCRLDIHVATNRKRITAFIWKYVDFELIMAPQKYG